MRDFTIESYQELLKAIRKNDIPVYSVCDWFQQKPRAGIMLRHDVDRKPQNALAIAKLEHESEIKSTYYFRVVKSSFDPHIISKIADLGHEIGYHYEDLSLAKGSYENAIRLFHKHLEKIRVLVSVKTIAMHGKPFSPYDNRDLWKKYDCRDFDILAEAYLDINYSVMYYLTDTGRTWKDTKANIRDNVKNNLKAKVHCTKELISFIESSAQEKIALVTHPERWSGSFGEWAYAAIKDYLVNFAKVIFPYISMHK